MEGVARRVRGVLGQLPALSLAGFAVFILITLAVHLRWLEAIDGAVAIGAHGLGSRLLDVVARGAAILFSFEVVLLAAGVCAFLLWRRGAGLWSLAPFGFVPLTLIEVGLKLTVAQGPLPIDLQRSAHYPLIHATLPGSFPSGHAMRIAFVCLLAGLALPGHSAVGRRLLAGVLIGAACVLALGRVYLGQHWISDVVAGFILGGSLSIALAAPLARLSRRGSIPPQPS